MSTDAPTPVDGAALLANLSGTFQLREESVQIILAPALLDEWEAKQDALAEAAMEDSKSPRMSSGGKQSAKTKKLAQELEDFEAGPLADAAVWFRFRAMSKDAYRALCAANPPRPGDQLDAYTGFNRQAVDDAMVRECLYDPVFEDCSKPAKAKCEHDDCGSWQQFVKKINAGEWAELERTCQAANRAVKEAPKSQLPSALRRLSDGASE